MKTLATLLILSFMATTVFARSSDEFTEEEVWSLFTVAPTATTSAPTYAHKDVILAAKEDAVKFVAFQGRGAVSPTLRQAITTLNEQLRRANIPVENDLKTADLIVLINSIESQK